MSDTCAPTDDSQPSLHRYRWQLEALRCGLADSMHALREAEAVLVQLRELQHAARNGAAAVSDRLDPLQENFMKCGAAQCGFCTPGIIVAAKALLAENPMPTTDEIRFALAGNICRCTGYTKIIDAIAMTARELQAEVA